MLWRQHIKKVQHRQDIANRENYYNKCSVYQSHANTLTHMKQKKRKTKRKRACSSMMRRNEARVKRETILHHCRNTIRKRASCDLRMQAKKREQRYENVMCGTYQIMTITKNFGKNV